ncbi:SPOR domain-containing protein [Novosphingobium sp. MMS21-SN21R]|uniref:SPOR domain-containing protein n=1 Tax=Novosphingobium sp. MMS21-SN21R TaxID=2969298 RepID=UPI002884896C|nr:SPOR domain-containing protein [Novosphingobium sp. MMS21-SN21R]MDT0508073.1 SPOR domain-containing protein [Novosphingobium sp. MMS21-SN21R]
MKSVASWIGLSAAVLLTACGGANARVSKVSDMAVGGPAGDYPMVLGEPFVVDGTTYTPSDTLNYDSVGYAVVDGGQGISGAHRTLPLPSYVEVTSLDTGRTILVRMTQRGPMQGSELVSLSAAAWAQLGAAPGARLPVRVRRVNPPEAERALLRAGSQVPQRMDTPTGLLAALKRKLGIPVAPALVAALDLPAVSQPAPVKPAKAQGVPAKPVAAPKPVTAPKAAPSASVPPKAEPKSPAKGSFVQVGAFSSRDRAESAAKSVGGSVAQVGKFWRVRTGPHNDRGQADAALAKARAAGYADARVVTAP